MKAENFSLLLTGSMRQSARDENPLNVALKEGFNDDEVLDFLQLTLLHNYDIIFMPTMDYDKIKAKLPGLRPVEGDFGDIDMYKYAIAKGRIGFIK